MRLRFQATKQLPILLVVLYSATASAIPDFEDDVKIINGCEIKPKTVCSDTDLSGADLSHANLHGAVFTNVKFNKTDLRHANLSYATFKKSNLDHADLATANLKHADLRSSKVRNANLEGVDGWALFGQGVDFTNSNFSGANLDQARLSGATMVNTNLRAARLERVWMNKANFEGASLINDVLQ